MIVGNQLCVDNAGTVACIMDLSINNNYLEKKSIASFASIIIADGDRRVLYCSDLKLDGCKTQQIQIKDGFISCLNPHDTLRLGAAISDAIKYNQEQILALRNQLGSIIDIVVAIPHIENSTEGCNGVVQIIVQHTKAKSHKNRDRLKSLFALTDTECSICESLLEGLDAKEIAIERGVSLSTVRSQLTSIMLKARCRRQVELVSVLSRVSVMN